MNDRRANARLEADFAEAGKRHSQAILEAKTTYKDAVRQLKSKR